MMLVLLSDHLKKAGTLSPRDGNESHSRGGGAPVRKNTSPVKNQKKSKKTRGRETRAREVKSPSPSMANHVLDLIF